MNDVFKKEWGLYRKGGARPAFRGVEKKAWPKGFDSPVDVGDVRVFARLKEHADEERIVRPVNVLQLSLQCRHRLLPDRIRPRLFGFQPFEDCRIRYRHVLGRRI